MSPFETLESLLALLADPKAAASTLRALKEGAGIYKTTLTSAQAKAADAATAIADAEKRESEAAQRLREALEAEKRLKLAADELSSAKVTHGNLVADFVSERDSALKQIASLRAEAEQLNAAAKSDAEAAAKARQDAERIRSETSAAAAKAQKLLDTLK